MQLTADLERSSKDIDQQLKIAWEKMENIELFEQQVR